MPRFLYGDSAPFPLSYDVLATLDLFITVGARVVGIDRAAKAAEQEATAAAAQRRGALDVLEQGHRAMMEALRETASRDPGGLLGDYARAVGDAAVRFVATSAAGIAQQDELEQGRARAEAERLLRDARDLLESFFVRMTMPAIEADYEMSLDEAGRHTLRARATYPGRVVVTYAIGNADGWSQPRRIAEFAHGMDVTVGARKSWFRRAEGRDVAHLDDLILGGYRLGEEEAEIRVRRKVDQRDALVVRMQRGEGGTFGQIEHPDEEGTPATPIEPDDWPRLEALWQILRSAAAATMPARERVLSIEMDGLDVFAARKVTALLVRLVEQIAPAVQLISEHTPNTRELALKLESDTGAREEIYLRKDELMARLEPLPKEDRALFVQFGLGPTEFFLPGVMITVDEDS